MNWPVKALTLLTLNFVLQPLLLVPVVIGACFISPWLLIPVLLPTAALCAAIATKDSRGRLPAWGRFLSTPDSPCSPFSQYEPKAASYYKFGAFIGDYLWLAFRNNWYGLAFDWGAFPNDSNDWFSFKGDLNVGNLDATGRFVYGTLRTYVHRNGQLYAWGIRRYTKVGPIMFVEKWGWKFLEDFYTKDRTTRESQNIVPPAMLAMQILLRKAK